MRIGSLKFFFALLWLCADAMGRPVSFKGGIAVDTVMRPGMGMIHSNYTLNRHLALGVSYEEFTAQSRRLKAVFPTVNLLLLRGNQRNSQYNVFVMGGGGYAHDSISNGTSVLYGSVAADFETRSFYTAAKVRVMRTPNVTPYFLQYRLGFAPYEGGYKDLQAWLIGQVDYMPDVMQNVQVMPLMRFYYRKVLWEIGSTFNGNWRLQLITFF